MCTISEISPKFKEQVNITYAYRFKILCQKINDKSFLLFSYLIIFIRCSFRGRGEFMAISCLNFLDSWEFTEPEPSFSFPAAVVVQSFLKWLNHFNKKQTILLVWLKLMVMLLAPGGVKNAIQKENTMPKRLL